MGFDTDIVNYGSTSSSLNIQLRFNIRRSAIHYQLVLFNAGMALESKYKLHLPPQMMKYTMIGRGYLRLTRDTGGIGGPCFRSYSLPTENSLRTQYVEKISERLLASTTRFFEVTQIDAAIDPPQKRFLPKRLKTFKTC